jgi:oligopeptide transport system substrate-binding protein
MKKFFSFIITIFLIVFSLCGCGDDYKKATIYYELSYFPSTLDPSVISDSTQTMISSNLFEGLMRLDYELNVVCGAAEKYEKSGNTYTFTLKKDLKWSNGNPLTAHDFVFGLKRGVDPKTNSPLAKNLFCIKNAAEISAGKLSVNNLGVKATDERTVVIETVGDGLLKALTTPPAMPCNEEFFNKSSGEYGMTATTTLSNGSYRIRLWDFDNKKIRISANPHYVGEFAANNTNVIFTKSDDLSPIQRLENANVDMAEISSTNITAAKALNLNCKTIENTVWVLTINENKFSKQLRTAFVSSFNRNKYSGALIEGYRVTEDVFPTVLKGSQTLDKLAFDSISPQSLFKNAIGTKPLPTINVYYYDDPVMKKALVDIAGNWQQLFGVTINLSPTTNLAHLQGELKEKNYDMCLFPVASNDGSLVNYLNNFSVNETDLNKAQNKILSDYSLIPVAVQDTCYAMTSRITKANISLRSEIIDFSFVIKKD